MYSRKGAEELRLFVKTEVLCTPCLVMVSSSHSSLIQQLGPGACGPPHWVKATPPKLPAAAPGRPGWMKELYF